MIFSVTLLLELLLLPLAAAEGIRSIFLFKDVMKSNTTALQTSGFNTLIMFGVGILDNGDIMYYSNTEGSSDVLVASEGAYTGGDALAAKVRSLKSDKGSGVNRIEICMNSANVASLMASPGPGSDTRLYRNFEALKVAWNLDAVNNDDESIYDVSSTAKFAKMLGDIGYKYAFTPYTRQDFWSALETELNKGLEEADYLMDRVYLQCYDGGAYNDPATWHRSLGLPIVPIVWVINDSKPSQGITAEAARTKFTNWNNADALAGGGYWNDYDIERMGSSYTDYGNVLTSIFPPAKRCTRA